MADAIIEAKQGEQYSVEVEEEVIEEEVNIDDYMDTDEMKDEDEEE